MNTQPQQQQGFAQSYDQSYAAYGYAPQPGAAIPASSGQQAYTQTSPAPAMYSAGYPPTWHGQQAAGNPMPAPMSQQQVYPQQQAPLPQQHYAPYSAAPSSVVGGYVPAPSMYGHGDGNAVTGVVDAYVQPAPPPATQVTAPPPPPSQEQAPETGDSVSTPLLQTPSQPLPAPAGQTLGAYAYPGGAQQQLTPQQVAQEAIAKTMASMAAQQPTQQENRRGYLYGTLIGEVGRASCNSCATLGCHFMHPAVVGLFHIPMHLKFVDVDIHTWTAMCNNAFMSTTFEDTRISIPKSLSCSSPEC